MKAPILFLFIFLFTLSCEKYPLGEGEKEGYRNYYGYWVSEAWTDSSQIFREALNLNEETYGFGILPGGKFVEKKNIGFCGTPPVVYGLYEGRWEENPEGNLFIETQFWGGEQSFEIKILNYYPRRMEVMFIYTEH